MTKVGRVEALSGVTRSEVRGAREFLDCAKYRQAVCAQVVREKCGGRPGKYVAARMRAGYFAPADYYEALLSLLVEEGSSWLDVGCGHAPLPHNLPLSAELARRSGRFVGIDPDPHAVDNRFVHEHYKAGLQEFDCRETFDLVTARMVVEHVERPDAFVAALARVTHPGSMVAIFTVNFWSVTTIAARYSPMSVHLLAKRWLWGTEDRDSFPTTYKMNDRGTLDGLMRGAGFAERLYLVLPDATLFWRIPWLRRAELACWQATDALRLPYFDSCILAVYERRKEGGSGFGVQGSVRTKQYGLRTGEEGQGNHELHE